ncbi:protein TIC 40, chloroplastic-like [Iris pallida]|uniref:Protein TIC 40, chloroplastic n=1 Tax=Iris pallida TaxID=29817 RepID=A0AAX6ESS2_IRIPA|nr:protein TIC 40, chloroplastic-like [Iris pallida]
MEKISLLSSKFPILVGAPNPSDPLNRRPAIRRLKFVASSSIDRDGAPRRVPRIVLKKMEAHNFARISSSGRNETSSISTAPPVAVPPPPSYVGSPLMWIGVGVGLSVLFSTVAARVKQYALQQAFKTVMGQAAPPTGQFGNTTFPLGSPFPFPAASPSDSGGSSPLQFSNTTLQPGTPFPFPAASPSASSGSSPSQVASRPGVQIDVPATEVESTPPTRVGDEPERKKEPKKYAFVDVSQEEVLKRDSEYLQESTTTSTFNNVHSEKEVSSNGSTFKQDTNSSTEQSQSSNKSSGISVEALEKMMEDPTVQKMVYPYLPEEMRNPTTFKWMLQNPQYRQQLEDLLNNMGGSGEWDNRMMDSLKNFDLSSPEVKQQFDQIGLTPEEVISKIMANPEVAMAFQNPRVQAAIMDCSQNPLSIAKYQNDKEVMDVFTKISELFPGMTGY